jgi:hypothetical protein
MIPNFARRTPRSDAKFGIGALAGKVSRCATALKIIGFVRIYLVLAGRPREARLLQDVFVGVVYLGTIAILSRIIGGGS